RDPNSAKLTLQYDAFGELVREYYDGVLSGEVTGRDRLGRITTTWNAEDGSTEYRWDTAPNGLGALAYTLTSDGVFTQHTYDSYGRRKVVSQTVGSGPTLASEIKYDSYGRVSAVVYPDSGKTSPLSVRYK